MAMTTKVELTGPLFENPIPVLNKVSKIFMQHLVELGEQRLDETLRPRPSGVYLSVSEARVPSTGNYRRNVSGKVTQNLEGIITDGNVIYGPWLEGISSRNQSTRFKGYASFRKTSQWLNKQIPKEADKFMKEIARRMNR